MPEVTTYRIENGDGVHEFSVEGRGLTCSSSFQGARISDVLIVNGGELQRFTAWLTRQVNEKFPPSREDPY